MSTSCCPGSADQREQQLLELVDELRRGEVARRRDGSAEALPELEVGALDAHDVEVARQQAEGACQIDRFTEPEQVTATQRDAVGRGAGDAVGTEVVDRARRVQ